MPQEGDYNLDMLGDVALNTPSDGDTLEYNATSAMWGTASAKMKVDGSNAADTVKFDGAFTVGENVEAFGAGAVALGKGDDFKAAGATYTSQTGTLAEDLEASVGSTSVTLRFPTDSTYRSGIWTYCVEFE